MKKLEGDEPFDSSKMQQHKIRPELDSNQINYIALAIARATIERTPITLQVFDEIAGEVTVTGYVIKMDQQLNRIKIEQNNRVEFVPFGNILRVIE